MKLKSLILMIILVLSSSIDSWAYSRDEIVEKLNSAKPGLASEVGNEVINTLTKKSDKYVDMYIIGLTATSLDDISVYMLKEYQNLKKSCKLSPEEMNNALLDIDYTVPQGELSHNSNHETVVCYFGPLLLWMGIDPDDFKDEIYKYSWRGEGSGVKAKIANEPLFIDAIKKEYNPEKTDTSVVPMNNALLQIINNLREVSDVFLPDYIKVSKTGNGDEVKITYNYPGFPVSYEDGKLNIGSLSQFSMFKSMWANYQDYKDIDSFKFYPTKGQVRIKQPKPCYNGNNDNYQYISMDLHGEEPIQKTNETTIKGYDGDLTVKVIYDPNDIEKRREYKNNMIIKAYVDFVNYKMKNNRNNNGYKWYFGINGIQESNVKLDLPTTSDISEVTFDEMRKNAKYQIEFKDGKVIDLYLENGTDILTCPYMDELCETTYAKFIEEHEMSIAKYKEEARVKQEKELAKEKAHHDDLIKRCNASNYLKMDLDDLEWLEKNGYITVDGYDTHTYSDGAYFTVINKKGVRKRLRMNTWLTIIGQR